MAVALGAAVHARADARGDATTAPGADAYSSALREAGLTPDQWSDVLAAAHRLAIQKQLPEPTLAAAAARMSILLAEGHLFGVPQAAQFLDRRADQLAVFEAGLARLDQPASGPDAPVSAQGSLSIRLIGEARAAAGAGDLDLAHQKLVEASDAARAAGQLGWAGAIRGTAAELRSSEFDFVAAAADYTAAAAMASSDDQRWGRLEAAGHLLQFRAGVFHDASPLVPAIDAYRQALTIFSKGANPNRWAQSEADLGLALEEVSEGGDAAAAREAVASLRHAEEVLTPDTDRQAWLGVQNNLANALLELGYFGDPGVLDDAAAAYRLLLEKRVREENPAAWAINQDNLATALIMLGARHNDPKAFADAVAAYRRALEVFTPVTDPHNWFVAEQGLASALAITGSVGTLPAADRRAALDEAVTILQLLLQDSPRDRDPKGWANLQMTLGNALLDRGKAGDAQSAKDAVEAYTQALSVLAGTAGPEALSARQQLAAAQALVAAPKR